MKIGSRNFKTFNIELFLILSVATVDNQIYTCCLTQMTLKDVLSWEQDSCRRLKGQNAYSTPVYINN